MAHPLPFYESEELFDLFRTDGEQAQELSDFISRCVPGMNLVDVGAHWGIFSLAALHFGAEDAQCLVVEASPAAARVLRSNLELNGDAGAALRLPAREGEC
jgi:predicted RNA methylase